MSRATSASLSRVRVRGWRSSSAVLLVAVLAALVVVIDSSATTQSIVTNGKTPPPPGDAPTSAVVDRRRRRRRVLDADDDDRGVDSRRRRPPPRRRSACGSGGDSLAAGPSWAVFVDAAATGVIKPQAEYQVGTGLVRNEFWDWPKHMDAVVRARDPQVSIFMVGANDDQGIDVNGTSVQSARSGVGRRVPPPRRLADGVDDRRRPEADLDRHAPDARRRRTRSRWSSSTRSSNRSRRSIAA